MSQCISARGDAWEKGRQYLFGFVLAFLLAASGPVPAAVRYDCDGDGKSDPVLYAPMTNQWLAFCSGSSYASGAVSFEGSWLAPIAADFDGDGKADPTVYDEENAVFYTRLSGNNCVLIVIAGFWGEGYVPVNADFDGDGKADPTLYCETSGTWLAMLSTINYLSIGVSGFGGLGYTPAPGDYDGDHRTDLAVYHGDSGMWRVRTSRDGMDHELSLGDSDSIAVHGDFDGDGLDDPAVYKEADGTWSIWLSASGTIASKIFGGWDMAPATGDYDGDGKTDLVLHCKTNDQWAILLSSCDYAGGTVEGDNEDALHPDSLGAHAADNDKSLPYTRLDWMSSLDTNKYLSEITIPGTHDTGADTHTSKQGCTAQFVIAQDFRIANQLRLGVRWFDIRLRLFNGGLCVHHANYYLHKNFDDMLQPALDYLKPGAT